MTTQGLWRLQGAMLYKGRILVRTYVRLHSTPVGRATNSPSPATSACATLLTCHPVCHSVPSNTTSGLYLWTWVFFTIFFYHQQAAIDRDSPPRNRHFACLGCKAPAFPLDPRPYTGRGNNRTPFSLLRISLEWVHYERSV